VTLPSPRRALLPPGKNPQPTPSGRNPPKHSVRAHSQSPTWWRCSWAQGIVAGDCSCPVERGDIANMLPRLLLTGCMNRSHSYRFEDLKTGLERRSRDELVSLIFKMIQRYPDLEMLLDLPAPGGSHTDMLGPGPDPPAGERCLLASWRRVGSCIPEPPQIQTWWAWATSTQSTRTGARGDCL